VRDEQRYLFYLINRKRLVEGKREVLEEKCIGRTCRIIIIINDSDISYAYHLSTIDIALTITLQQIRGWYVG